MSEARAMFLVASPPSPGVDATSRLRVLFAGCWDPAARTIRNLGAPARDIEDLLQQAFSITAARLKDIEPGKERAFLMETAVRLAIAAHRRHRATHEVPTGSLPEVPDAMPSPEDLSDRHRTLEVLDKVLDQLSPDLRAVFVLFEIEEMTMAEIAIALDLPAGTVASRLRRAREAFLVRVRKLKLDGSDRGRVR
ncbi:MAG TPA: sigma-70 family RNA polymerase sigma factor [Polyangia bacterium]